MKPIIKIFGVFIVLSSCAYAFLFYQNNRAATPVGDERLLQSYEHSVAWLLSHRADILSEGNPILWWMLEESARITGDQRVKNLFDEFLDNFERAAPYSVWQTHFHPERFRGGVFSPSEYASLVEYQQYFLYTMTCSQQLAQEPLVKAQNNPDFCWHGSRIIRPACVTHQLMGYRMAQRSQCAIDNLDANIAVLQNTIETQLRYDPRVIDVYIQRVLMLVDSGASERVNPRWLERVIDAQQKDGGWSRMQPLIPVGGGKYLAFDAKAMTIAEPVSNFHTTAQGVLLTSLLLRK